MFLAWFFLAIKRAITCTDVINGCICFLLFNYISNHKMYFLKWLFFAIVCITNLISCMSDSLYHVLSSVAYKKYKYLPEITLLVQSI